MSGFVAVRGHRPEGLLADLIAASDDRGLPDRWDGEGVSLVALGAPIAVEPDLVVAADARIDNRAEVDAALGVRPESDAMRILVAWRRWRVGALDRLIGDFAFAVWDRRTRELLVARDPLGARPAILARGDGRVLAASAVATLLADMGVDRRIDERFVASYLAAVAGYRTVTGYRGIERLDPWTYAVADHDRWRTRRWFEWRPRRVRERDPRAYGERFRELFFEAVRCRAAGARRLGIMLSGGLDSTSVCVTARELFPDAEIVAVSMAFEDRRGDERALQRLVADRAGARLRFVPVVEGDPFAGGSELVFRTMGTPSVPPNRYHGEIVADAASEEGVDVALDGIDGDGVVGGNWFYLSDLLARGRWAALRRELLAIRRVQNVPARTLLRHYAVTPLLPAAARIALRRMRGRPSPVPACVDPRFAERMRIERMIEGDGWRPGFTHRAVERSAVATDILPLTLEMLNEQWGRRGIQISHPFLDRRLVEFCLGLPRGQKIAGGYTKLVLRSAMEGLLPTEVAARSDKAELSEPFFAGLWGSGRDELAKGLHLAASNPSPWFVREEVERLRPEGERRRGEAYLAFRVAFLALWREWLDRREDRTMVPHRRRERG